MRAREADAEWRRRRRPVVAYLSSTDDDSIPSGPEIVTMTGAEPLMQTMEFGRDGQVGEGCICDDGLP